MDESRTLGQMINCAAHLFRERADARLAKYDVTPAQAYVILYLSRQGGQVTQQSLGAHLRIKPSTVNGIVDRMVERGLIKRSLDEFDARRRHLLLTDEGGIQLQCFRQELLEAENVLESCFTPKELVEFQTFLGRVIQKLEEERNKC